MTGYNAKVGMRKPQRGIRVRRKGEYVVNAADIAAYKQLVPDWQHVLNWGSST